MSQHAFSPISQRLRATGTVLDSLVAARRSRLPELYEACLLYTSPSPRD